MPDRVDPGRTWVATTKQLAELCKIDVRQVQRWAREHGLPTLGRGKLDLADAIPWLMDYCRGKSDAEMDIRAELTRAQTRKLDLEAAEQLGQLVRAEDVDELTTNLCQLLISTLDALPGRASHQVFGCETVAQAEAALAAHVADARARLARRIRDDKPRKKPGRNPDRAATPRRNGKLGGPAPSPADRKH